MMNRDMQAVCIKRMKDIVGVYGEGFKLIQLSNENIEKALLKIVDVGIKANVILSSTVKDALYNLENFRPEIRSAFEYQLFNVWHNAFKTLDIDQSDDVEPEVLSPIAEKVSEAEENVEEVASSEEPEPEAEEIVEVVTSSEAPEPEAEQTFDEQASVQQPEPIEKEPAIEYVEATEKQGVELEPHISEQSVIDHADEPEESLKRIQRDWFDLILDISASFMQFFMRLITKKNTSEN